jgi:predicted RNase H-like nuclease (RuvC/YqgF family)
MTDTDPLEEAASRLNTALDTFEKRVAERRHADLSAEELQEQVQRLTENLGAEREKSEALSTANDEVSERLDSIIDSVRTILETR